MANFSIEQLLTYPPFEAALIAYNDIHGTRLNPRYVVLDSVVSTDGPLITIRIKSRPHLPNVDEKVFTGQADITIRRLDLGKLFSKPLVLKHFDEIASTDVARAITQLTGIVFDDNDVVKEVLTTESPVLHAHPNSLRWYGELVVETEILPSDLSNVLPETHMGSIVDPRDFIDGTQPICTGPGPAVLVAGTETLGYYGVVTSDELFGTYDLLRTLGHYDNLGGVVIVEQPEWLKFSLNRKTIYVAKTPVAKNVSWDRLYAAGLVYGTDNAGIAPTGDSVNQMTVMTKDNQYLFKVRLLGGLSATGETNGSEWDTLLGRVSNSDSTGTFWETFSDTDLGIDLCSSWTPEVMSGNISNRVQRGVPGNGLLSLATRLTSAAENTDGWRPVLEQICEELPLEPLELVGYSADTTIGLTNIEINNSTTTVTVSGIDLYYAIDSEDDDIAYAPTDITYYFKE